MKNIDFNEFKELLDAKYTQEQLAAKYNCSVFTIKKYKRENGLVGYKTNKKPLSEKDIIFLTSCADQGKGFNESCKLLGITPDTVRKYIPDALHIRLSTNGRFNLAEQHRVGTLKRFLVPDAETAYFTGLLQSDGCITKDGVVSLTSIDKDLVLPLSRFMGSNLVSTGKGYWFTQVKEIKLVDNFKIITGIYPQKTYTQYIIPKWIRNNDEYMWNFIVGVFNGDGSVAAKANGAQLQIEQHSSQAEFLKELGRFLGWNTYLYEYAKIQTSKRSICEDFFHIFSNNENSLLRKVTKLESLLY